MSRYLIHYFSGTGNTYHMVKNLEKEIKDKGNEVELLNIEAGIEKAVSDYEINIFCFPIYGFGTPSIMLRYISKLKKMKSKAIILCSSAGFEGQSLNHCKQKLEKKGFKVIFTDMIVYTYNWTQILNPPNKETEEKLFRDAEVKIKEIVEMIVCNNVSFKKRNIITLFISWIIFSVFSNIARRILGKTFIADNSCVSCEKCKKICPSKAIGMEHGRPTWNFNCESCQRCINVCPKKSIQLSIVKLFIYASFELIPIFLIAYLNRNFISLPLVVNIILYIIMFSIGTLMASGLIYLMEKGRFSRRILEISYTKFYRRNIAKGFNIV